MVSYHRKGRKTKEVIGAFENCPLDGKTLQLNGRIAFLSIREGLGGTSDDIEMILRSLLTQSL